jgi:hypothetical protein
MGAIVMSERITGAWPRFKARIAGVFLFARRTGGGIRRDLSARQVSGRRRLIAVSCFVAETLVLFDIFKPVNGRLSLFAASFNLVGMTLEAHRLNPHGVDIALMALAGLAWMTFLLPPLANYRSPYSVASGIVGEGSPMLWLLVMGVRVERWQEAASAAGRRT